MPNAKARLAAELGMDERFVDIHIPMGELREKASDLTRDILPGTSDSEGIERLFTLRMNDYVKAHLAMPVAKCCQR